MSYQIGKKNKIDDLKFMVTLPDDTAPDGFDRFNIFDHYWVKEAIYRYKTKSIPADRDLCAYFFIDFWGRCEYEMVVNDWPGQKHERKVDVYEMYIKPNFPLLLEMIDSVTISSCRAWHRKNKR